MNITETHKTYYHPPIVRHLYRQHTDYPTETPATQQQYKVIYATDAVNHSSICKLTYVQTWVMLARKWQVLYNSNPVFTTAGLLVLTYLVKGADC